MSFADIFGLTKVSEDSETRKPQLRKDSYDLPTTSRDTPNPKTIYKTTVAQSLGQPLEADSFSTEEK